MKISYSASAKVILSGEHAVVYGKPALVSAINLRLKFYLWEESIKINDKNILFISDKVKGYLRNIKINFVDRLFNFKIESEIPIGRGLGSSAALSVASVASFLEFYTGRQFDKKIINELAFAIEKHFHSNPSGADNTASCFGGLILYQKQKSLKNLDYKIPKNIEEKLFLIDSGKPEETTGEMVDFVKTKINEDILNVIEKITSKLVISIKKNDEPIFKKCLVDNEKQLEKLGVVSDKTRKLLATLSKFGVGKVTGAGGIKEGSGFILFYADKIKELTTFLQVRKISYYKFIPDITGLIRL
ncbi:MAG: hypothetical protein NUV87_04560 [Candidatus Roizmanbacteria bacterium]|nr:hypothetical protein [Candidatus Roizmanbacteria bacterium]